MGIVYLAEHTKLRQQYVVKILNPALTAAEDTVQRFFREAQSVARLNHPCIVGIQNVGQEGEYYYIRMEFVDGDTVENIVKEQKKLDWHLATKIVFETSEALSHAHKRGTIHRDIKPENIMLARTGEVKVMDFGLAKQVQSATKVSMTGQIVGTPFFMSPEQAGGKTVDARSDIYSLGVSYYYMLTGVKPFNGKNLQEIFLKHFFYTPESPKIYTPDLPENVCEVIRRCLKKKKKERYQSAAQLGRDLQAILSGGELSAAEGVDTESASASASTPDFQPSGGDGGRTSRAFASTSSDPAIPLNVGDTVSRDLAAAQAEIGAGDPGTVVSTPRGNGGSATVIAKAIEAHNAPPSEDVPAAPVSKRAGQRVSLGKVSGASLVFGQRPDNSTATAPEPEAAQVEAPVEAKPEPPKKLSTKLDKKPVVVTQKKTKTVVLLGVVLGLLVAYEVVGLIRFGSLEARYAELQNTQPGIEDADGWGSLHQRYDELGKSFQGFATMFRFTPRAELANAHVEHCAEQAKNADAQQHAAATLSAETKKAEIHRRDVALHREEYNKKLTEILAHVKQLIREKKYSEAASEAYNQGYFLAKDVDRANEVTIPVEITCDQPAQIVNGINNEPKGKLEAGTPYLLLAPVTQNNKDFTIELRMPRFKTWVYKKPITDHFVQLKVALDREVKHNWKLGKTDDLRVGRFVNIHEPLRVVAPMVLDTQEPLTLDVVCHDGTLRSLELRSFRPRWTRQQLIGDYGDRLPPPEVNSGQAIVTANPDGIVRAHDVPTGNVVCQANVGSPVSAPARIDPDNKYVVVGTLAGDVVCLEISNVTNGIATERWRVHTEAPIATQPLIQGNKVLAGSLDDRLRVIDAQTGKVLSVFDAREAICASQMLTTTSFIGTREGRVHALTVDAANHVKLAFPSTAPTGAPILSIIASPGKGVFYATKNDLRSIDPNNSGSRIFETWAPSQDGIPLEIAGIALMNDAIAVVTSNGSVFSVDPRTGVTRWKLSLGATVKVPPLFDGTDLYVATDGPEQEKVEVVQIAGD
jgi:serine/threonine protein kinase/outer membrane protein assembly factor BamB